MISGQSGSEKRSKKAKHINRHVRQGSGGRGFPATQKS